MEVEVSHTPRGQADAELVCVGVFEDEDLPEDLRDAPGAEDAQGKFRKLSMLRLERDRRVLAVGLGKRSDLDGERMRCAGALAIRQAQALKLTSLAWELPEGDSAEVLTAGMVEGSILGAYRFNQLKTDQESRELEAVERLTVLADEGLRDRAAAARISAAAQNRARDLQNLPSNTATPSYLAGRAEEIDEAHPDVRSEVMGPDEIAALGMGGLVAVSQGAIEEPRLIVLRYEGAGEDAETIGLVGKGVTFDTGGISIKPSQGMHEMKMDMSGAATVLETVGAAAELELPVNVLAVTPCTENMPSGTAIKPGDVITQYNGKTVEVINTDAEGRLILADALAWCAEQGADRIVDVATLTGAVLVALGSTYCALLSNDDEWAAEIEAAATATGELAWRLPLHPEYKKLTESKVADLTNASEKRKAGTIYAASFLSEFVGDVPWAHLDIAGTAWGLGRDHVGEGASGFGVRLLLELLRSRASA